MPNAAAFFDLDRTLISGSSSFAFGVEAWRQGLAGSSDISRWALAAVTFIVTGDKDEGVSIDIRTEFLTQIKGAEVSTLDAIGQAVLPKLVSRVRPEARKLLTMHHEAGRETWIVSASPQRIVGPIAASLGMTGAIGNDGKVLDGRFTGDLDGEFIYGEGKALAITELAAERDYDLKLSYAYSDSVSDLPMLDVVGHPVAVNPDSDLERKAHERGWPVVIFARKTKRVVATSGVAAISITAAGLAYALGRHHGRTAALVSVATGES